MRKTNIILRLVLCVGLLGAFMPAALPALAAAGAPGPVVSLAAGAQKLAFSSQGLAIFAGSRLARIEFQGASGAQPKTAAGGQALNRVDYAGVWPGVSVAYTAIPDGIVKSTYTLAPGAAVDGIRLRYNAPAVKLEKDGSLGMYFPHSRLRESAPVAWQMISGQRVAVPVAFKQLDNRTFGFSLGAYNPAFEVVIDPSITWSVFIGGATSDFANAIATDSSGNVYVAGYSDASWGSTPVAPYNGGAFDGFVAKLSPSGTVLWNTFVGGLGDDDAFGIAVDATSVYVTGSSSQGWGTNVINPYGGLDDTYVAQLNASTGVLGWNTFLGSVSGNDFGNAIAVGSSGVIVAGQSGVSWGSPQRAFGALSDGFVASLNPTTGALNWNTFQGGTGTDNTNSIAVDGSGNVYGTGLSDVAWAGPTVRAFDGAGASLDAFAFKLSGAGILQWNTFLGGDPADYGNALTVDASGNAFVTGESYGSWGTPVRAFTENAVPGSTQDAFVARLDTAGALQWNTFLGGAAIDTGEAARLDGSGGLYIGGMSTGLWGNPANSYNALQDALFARISSATGAFQYNSFIGGAGDDLATGLAVDSSDKVFVAGTSSAAWGASPFFGGTDGFVTLMPQCIYSAGTGTFSAGASWQGGSAPLANDGACVSSGDTITLNANTTVKSLIVFPGGKLIIPAGFSLTVTDFVVNNGTLQQTITVSAAGTNNFLNITNGTTPLYFGLMLTSTAAMGDVTVSIQHLNDGEFCTKDFAATVQPYVSRCFRVQSTAGGNVTIRLYGQTSELNGLTATSLAVFDYEPVTTPLWVEKGPRTVGTQGPLNYYAAGGPFPLPANAYLLLSTTGGAPTAIRLTNFTAASDSRGIWSLLAFSLVGGLAIGGLVMRRWRVR